MIQLRSSHLGDFHADSNVLSDSFTVSWVDFVEELDHPFFDVLTALAEWARNVCDDILTVLVTEDLVEKNSRLFIIGVGVLMGIPAYLGVDLLSVDGVGLVFNRTVE